MDINESPSDPSINLLDLNDDCLLSICHHLTIGESFELIGLFGRRFDEVIYRRIAHLKHLQISLRDYPNYNREQLAVIGSNLRSLSFTAGYSMSDEKVLQLLRPLCAGLGSGTALQQLTLNYVHFKLDYANCIGLVASQLTSVDLSFCQLNDSLLEPLLRQCIRLRKLKLLGNYTLNGLSLRAVNAKVLRFLEVELHELWSFDIGGLHAQHPQIAILAYDKGRFSQTLYGESPHVQ